jgi:hypothetical protein
MVKTLPYNQQARNLSVRKMLYRGKLHFEDRKMQKIPAARKIMMQKRLLLIQGILRRRLYVRKRKLSVLRHSARTELRIP